MQSSVKKKKLYERRKIRLGTLPNAKIKIHKYSDSWD